MAPFSIPAPCIVPLRTPVFGGSRAVDTQTKIELMCETYLPHEIFYTLDGSKPQPYAGIVQGSKLYKYKCPFCLPAGKITVKAIALNTYVHSMRSNVVTKYFEVIEKEADSVTQKKSSKGIKKENNISRKKRKPQCTSAPRISTPASNKVEKVDFEQSEDVKESHDRRESLDSIEEFPPDLDYFPGEVNPEDLSDAGSINSIPEEVEEFKAAEYNIEDNVFAVQNSPPTEKEHDSQENGESISLSGQKNESLSKEEDENILIDKKPLLEKPGSAAAIYCIKCETVLLHCHICTTLNTTTSKYCIHCGQKLMQKCSKCTEFNSVLASFCQFCGKKVELDVESQISYADHSMMAEPQKMHASVQQSLSTENKGTQTVSAQREKKDNRDSISPRRKKLPSHSPGRGYWHQQLDYICNHLKSYAYNNIEFRDSISEPMLSDFQKAEVIKDDDSISLTISFTPFVFEKENDVKYLNQKS
ncbi:uncharacterized protein TNIN_307401 [Trichonephila inaurata madagascariensis]|uniref:DZANK-type domain-containing protein n=1 Tax=Trichonephila inaurata madagascariensis TaxID=2747483 RepID=A0A8X6KFP1_9ARAC|nr:uncharacterized protein TNIN_307401 [Trichonephila inaurata madagascariensis]